MANKFDRLVQKIRGWVRAQTKGVSSPGDPQNTSRHPGRAYEARIEIRKPKIREYRDGPEFKGNPHVGSWKRYTQHLFDLMLEGHGRTPAAMQVRDRLNFHWRFLDMQERSEAVGFYHQQKTRFENSRVEREVANKVQEDTRNLTRDLYSEVDEFMNPRGN